MGGRSVIAVIGVDRYHRWPGLANAVRDATGASALFQRLGFQEITVPLLDERATGQAIQSLVTDDLMTLGPSDSLVLFFAGHGGTREHCLGDEVIKAGYLIPVDASRSPDRASTWVDLEGWLRAVSLLPAKHVLVVLDACHSGIALDPIIKWRDIGSWQDTPLATLRARRSRRIITSALDDQVALDSGPVHGHSLFTGCLIEGLTDGIRRGGRPVTTGSELGLYVQRRVQTYPSSRQTPDFGTFAFDDRGEMVIPLAIEHVIERAEPATAAGSSAWIDLIDLGDEPELPPEVASRTDGTASGAEIPADRERLATVEPVPESVAGAAGEPPLASAAASRGNEAAASVDADDAAVVGPEPASEPAGPASTERAPQPALALPAAGPPPPTLVSLPDSVLDPLAVASDPRPNLGLRPPDLPPASLGLMMPERADPADPVRTRTSGPRTSTRSTAGQPWPLKQSPGPAGGD